MKNSKNLALMFLLGTFLTGGVLGFTANRFMHRDQVCYTANNGNSSLLALLSQRLNLTADQQHRVDAILDERLRQYRRVMDPIRPRTDSIKEFARDQIRALLNDEQKREFEALIVETSDTTRQTRKD